MEKSDF